MGDARGTTGLAEQVRLLRCSHGMSLKAFAKALGVTPARAAKFEDDDFDGWTASVLRNIARVFNVHLDARFVSAVPAQSAARAWDPYSPVAMVLWRAADLAEAGLARGFCLHAARELGCPDLWIKAVEVVENIRKMARVDAPFDPLESERIVDWAVALRIAAEFGPAGRRP